MNPNEIKKLKKLSVLPVLFILILFCLPSFYILPEQEACESAVNDMEASIKDARKAIEQTSLIVADEKKFNDLQSVIMKQRLCFLQKTNCPI